MRRYWAVIGLALLVLAATTSRHNLTREDINLIHPGEYGSAFTGVTLAAALADIGSAERTLLIYPGTWTIGTNLTVPANVRLSIPQGSLITVAEGITLTINGDLDCGDHQQCFAGSGTVRLSKIDRVRPTWFGMVCSDSLDDTNAINKAMTSITLPNAQIELCSGEITVAGTILVNHALIMAGQGSGNIASATVLNGTSTNLPVIEIQGGILDVTLKDFKVTRSVNAVDGGTGIRLNGVNGTAGYQQMLLQNLFVMNQWVGYELGICTYCKAEGLVAVNNNSHGFVFTYGAGGTMQWEGNKLNASLNNGSGIRGASSSAVNNIGPWCTDCLTFGNNGPGFDFVGTADAPVNDLWLIRPISSADNSTGIHLDTHGFGHMIVSPWVELAGMSGFPVGSTVSPITSVASQEAFGIALVNNDVGLNIVGGKFWNNALAAVQVQSTSPQASLVGAHISQNGGGATINPFVDTGIQVGADDFLVSGVSFGLSGNQTSYIYYVGDVVRTALGANTYNTQLAETSWISTASAPGISEGIKMLMGQTVYTGTNRLFKLVEMGGGSTSIKYIDVASGLFRVLNSTFTDALFTLTDAGIPAFPEMTAAPSGSHAVCANGSNQLFVSTTGSCPP